MNQLIIKKASILSFLFGTLIGLLALIPPAIGLSIFVLSFFSSVAILLFMKKNDKLGFLNNEEGAIFGGITGFFASIGFFASFTPMILILRLIFKNMYSYAIPYMIGDAFWLFLIIVLMVGLIFALTNSVTCMGLTYLLNKIEEKPENHDAPLDIEIKD